MKRFVYLIIVALFSSNQLSASSFYLHFYRPAEYTVTIDGMYYRVAGNNFVIPTLREGRHNIVIETYQQGRGRNHRPMPVVLYNGCLSVRACSDVFASVDMYGFHVDRVVAQRYENRGKRGHYHYRYNDNNNRYDDYYEEDNDNQNDHHYNSRENDYQYNNRENDDNRNGRGGNRGGNGRYNRESGFKINYMDNSEFDRLKTSIQGASFESTKSNIAKQGMMNNDLSINQIAEILRLFSFESTKLEVARYAYDYTSDKNEFYQLANEFTFDSNKNEITHMGS